MNAPSWTIAELGERVARALAGDDAPDNGRVRAVPDERAIRYYTTLGLLDRPALRGRTALYGVRHLAQLVAIKRMQADGKSLAEIQHELPALDDTALATWSGVALSPAPRAKSRAGFWKATPSAAPAAVPPPPPPPAIAPAPAPAAAPPPAIGAGPMAPAEHPSLVRPATRIELELGDGVRISFTPARPVTDADILALRIASAPVLAHLIDRGLVT